MCVPSRVTITTPLLALLLGFQQPRSLGLSSLPPLVVGIKTLVAAGHVTTQNLGGKKKKSVGREGWQSVLIVVVVNLSLSL